MRAFQSLKDRVWNCLPNRKNNFLSQAGKEILLKVVVQSIPTYCMSVFLIPISLCKEIHGLMQQFWWGHKENTSKISWVSWEKMGLAKSDGGLGFWDLVSFNTALLAKQIWRLLINPNSLAARVIGAKYFPSTTVLEAQVGKRPSFAWRSIMAAKGLVKQGLIWRIGDGSEIKIWGDRWIPTPTTFMIQSPIRGLEENDKVEVLINHNSRSWKSTFIDDIFLPHEAQVIKSIPLSPIPTKDKLVWRCTPNGQFSVWSAYHLEMETKLRMKGGGLETQNKEGFGSSAGKLTFQMRFVCSYGEL